MNRGADVSGILPALARAQGFTQATLEEATGIRHSTMSRYWSGRGGLGLANGRKIAVALGVDINRLGVTEEGEAVDELPDLRRALAALEETVALLAQRVTTLEHKPAEPRRVRPTQKRTA